MDSKDRLESEERLLRSWTPLVLRTSLFTSVVLLITGLIVGAIAEPGYYVDRIHDLQRGAPLVGHENWGALVSNALAGHPHDILTVGLLVLTLVPLGRVGLSLIFFTLRRDLAFVLLTGYVLAMLIVGIALGRVG